MSVGGGITPGRFPIGDDKVLDSKLTSYCAPKHWDPTMIFRYSVPNGMGTNSIALPMDPRPWAKICQRYVNSGPAEVAPSVPENMVIPGAGEFYPPGRYASAIEEESRLRRLDRPLNEDLLPGTCKTFRHQYVLPATSDALEQWKLLPAQRQPRGAIVRGLADPPVLERLGEQYRCSEEAMVCDIKAAPLLFNNFTKLAKYSQKDGKCGNMLWQYTNGKAPSAENLPRPQMQ